MKKLLKIVTVASILILVVTSCSNEELMEAVLPAETAAQSNAIEKNLFHFKYQGVQYAAEYNLEDSTMVFTDPAMAEMLSKLDNNPDVSTLTYPNGAVQYFDTSKELENFLEKGRDNTPQTKLTFSQIKSITLKIYEHADFKGDVLTYNSAVAVPHMSNAYNSLHLMEYKDFNDIASSFKLSCYRIGSLHGGECSAVVVFYRDAEYKSTSKAFVLDKDHDEISLANFKKIKFNDVISSFNLYTTAIAYPNI